MAQAVQASVRGDSVGKIVALQGLHRTAKFNAVGLAGIAGVAALIAQAHAAGARWWSVRAKRRRRWRVQWKKTGRAI